MNFKIITEILMQITCLVIFLWILKRLFYKPLQKAIEHAGQKIRTEMEKSDKTILKAESLLFEQKEILNNTINDAENIKQFVETLPARSKKLN